MVTLTLYDIIQSELIKKGFNEFVNSDGELVFFDEEYQFIQKILSYDEDVQEIVDRLFHGVSLTVREHDEHFKRTFIYRFINRQINRQTIESFKLELMYNFLANEQFLNSIYSDMEKYLTNTQTNEQESTGSNLNDSRSAYAELPQNSVQLDVNDTVMQSANENTISRSKQSNEQGSSGVVKNYRLDELFKTNGILEEVFNGFDQKCFLQVW